MIVYDDDVAVAGVDVVVAGVAKVGGLPDPAEVKTCPAVPVATATGSPLAS